MASSQWLLHAQDVNDPHAVDATIPAASHLAKFTCPDGPWYIVVYVGNPVGLFVTLPNGSISIDPTNHHTYTKTGDIGSGTAGAWVVNA